MKHNTSVDTFEKTSAQLAVILNASSLMPLLNDLYDESTYSSDIESLLNYINAEINNFQQSLNKNGINHEVAFAASYIICSTFDDAFSFKNLYDNNSQKGFLLQFHNEPGALSRFYELAEIIQKDKLNDSNIDLAILILTFLEIGYKGKYRNSPDCDVVISHYKQQLSTAINLYKKTLTIKHRPIKVASAGKAPAWVIASITLLLSISTYKITDYLLEIKHRNVERIISKLNNNRYIIK